jgi:hypothetical protein
MKHVYLFLLLLSLPGTGLAQSLVSDVKIRMLDDARMEILYHLHAPADSVWIEAEARYGGQLNPSPNYLYGDVGRRVRPGSIRRIVWYLYDEGQRIKSDVRVKVLTTSKAEARPAPTSTTTPLAKNAANDTVRGPRPPRKIIKEASEAIALSPSLTDKTPRSVGPGWAAVSAVLPGVGNMFVHRGPFGKPTIRVGLRPLVTVGFYGLVLYGLNQNRLSDRWYTQYTQQKNPREGEPYYEMANQYHHRAFVATRVAGVIWATDVALTFLRGLHNQQEMARQRPREPRVKVRPGVQGKTPVANLRIRL